MTYVEQWTRVWFKVAFGSTSLVSFRLQVQELHGGNGDLTWIMLFQVYPDSVTRIWIFRRERLINYIQLINSHLSQKGKSRGKEHTYVLHLSSMDIVSLFTGQPILPSVWQVQTIISAAIFVGYNWKFCKNNAPLQTLAVSVSQNNKKLSLVPNCCMDQTWGTLNLLPKISESYGGNMKVEVIRYRGSGMTTTIRKIERWSHS